MPEDTQTMVSPPTPQLSATQVPIVDPTTNQPFDLRNINVATADRLRPLLPAPYQQQAQQIEDLVKQFQSFSLMDVPQGFSFERELPRLADALRRGVTDFSNDPNLKWAYDHLRDAPGIRESLLAAQDMRNIGEGALNQTDAYSRGNAALSNIGRVFDVFRSSALDGESLTAEQARAFGTAYAAATYKAAQGGTGQAVDTHTTFMDTALSWLQWPCSIVLHLIPRDLFGMDIPHLLLQATDAVSAMVHGQWNWNEWGASWEAAGREATQTLSTETQAPSREEFERRNTVDRVRREQAGQQEAARPDATATIVAAGSIAGINHTPELARLVMTGGVIRDQQGRLFMARYADGRLVTEPVNGVDGKQLTINDEYTNAGQNLLPRDISQIPGYLLGLGMSVAPYAIPGYAGIRITQGFYEGAWRAPAARATTLETRAAGLTARATSIEAGTPSLVDRIFRTTPEALRDRAAVVADTAAPFRAAADTRATIQGGEALAESAAVPTRFSWLSPRSWGRGIGGMVDRAVSGTGNILGAGIRMVPGGGGLLRVGDEALTRIGLRAGLRGTPLIGAVASVGFSGYDIYDGVSNHDTGRTLNGSVSMGATVTGGVIGTCICPGLGTLIGAGIGGLVGWIGGGVTEAVYDNYHPEEAVLADRRRNGEPQAPGGSDPGVDQAARDAAARAEAARRQADAQRSGQPIAFASVTSVSPPQPAPGVPQGQLPGMIFGAVT